MNNHQSQLRNGHTVQRYAPAVSVYITAIITANILTDHYGMVPVGFGLTVTAGTYAAGIALLARDLVQDTAGRRVVLAAIGAGAVLSVWLANPALALASGVAFLVAELADMAVYTPLRSGGWARAVLPSNAVGAVVDTVLFLWIAGFPVWSALPGQLIGKAVWATALPVAVVITIRAVRRAVSREPLHVEGA